MNELRKMHLDVFDGKINYIPLIVKVKGGKSPYIQWDTSHNPELAIEKFHIVNDNSMKVKSDWIPNIESDFVQSLIGSMWGAKKFKSIDGSLDIMPVISSPHQGAYDEIDIFNKDLEFAIQHLEYIKNNAPDGVTLTMTRFLSPLDNAVVIRGSEFYLELLTQPKESTDFLVRIAEVTIQTALKFKEILNDPIDRCVTNRGIYFSGIRLTGDAIVNLSPNMIRSIMCPIFDIIASAFGSVMLHYCCTPAPSGHVLSALSDCTSLRAVYNWQGYHTFFDEAETDINQEHTAIITDLSSDIVLDPKSLHEKNPFFSDVARENGRAIVVTTHVDSVDEGRRIYDNWKNYFGKPRMSGYK